MIQGIAFKKKEVEILEAFLMVTQKEGIEAVTLQKVASEAKAAYSTVHYYFGRPERNLVDCAFDYVVTNSVEFLEEGLSGSITDSKVNSLKLFIEKKFEWNERFPVYASIWTYFLYLTQRDEKYKKMNTEIMQMMGDKLQTLLITEMGKGRYPLMKKLDILISQIQQVLFGGQILTINHQGKNRHKMTWQMIENLIQEHALKHSTKH